MRTLKKGEEESQNRANPYLRRTTKRSKGLHSYYLYHQMQPRFSKSLRRKNRKTRSKIDRICPYWKIGGSCFSRGTPFTYVRTHTKNELKASFGRKKFSSDVIVHPKSIQLISNYLHPLWLWSPGGSHFSNI